MHLYNVVVTLTDEYQTKYVQRLARQNGQTEGQVLSTLLTQQMKSADNRKDTSKPMSNNKPYFSHLRTPDSGTK